MSTSRHQQIARRKRRIARRLRPRTWTAQPRPMYTARNMQYEQSDRVRGLGSGGIGVLHRLAQHTGLVEAIDRHVQVLKVHLPYHESDHVLGIAYNVLCGGTCLQDIEQRRQDEVYLDALGAQRIPDPTTAGDFCRRFDEVTIEALQTGINETRLRVWGAQPAAFFEEAIIDADGTLAETTGQCKEGMDIAYNGVWGYHPLVVSLANTQEPLFLVNRSGNRPSAEGAAERFDQAGALCRTAGFQRLTFRGDTDFTQTRHLDRWEAAGVRFVVGCDARANLIREADALPPRAWRRLVRRPPIVGSVNAVLYLYTPEIDPTRMRAIDTGSATCWLRLASAAGPLLVGYIVAERGTGAVFLMFAAAGVIGALAATLMLETRNRRLEDIAP